jgi:hypothetical protein
MAKKTAAPSFNWQLYVALSAIVLMILPATLLSIRSQNELQSQAAGFDTIVPTPTVTPLPQQ